MIVQHPDYERFTEHDVAILRPDEPFKLNDMVGLACLPRPGMDYAGSECYISGWGKLR